MMHRNEIMARVDHIFDAGKAFLEPSSIRAIFDNVRGEEGEICYEVIYRLTGGVVGGRSISVEMTLTQINEYIENRNKELPDNELSFDDFVDTMRVSGIHAQPNQFDIAYHNFVKRFRPNPMRNEDV